MSRVLALSLLASCASPVSPVAHAAVDDVDALDAAASLDPACYQMVGTTSGQLDVTVPDGHWWLVTNAFAVYYGDPIDVAQDGFTNTRRSGFIRPLDARRPLTLGAGTRVRGNVGINLSYVLYCDPLALAATDARYADPRSLLDQRRRALRQLPTQSVIVEGRAGGAVTDDVHADLPTAAVMLTSASVYDASWVTVACPEWSAPANALSEINNDHAVRFAESILHPLPACGARVTMQKGTLGDTWGPTTDAVGVSVSEDPSIASPIHGSVSLTYQTLPVDW